MSNQFFSLDVSSIFTVLIVIVLWISIIRVIAGIAIRIALTMVALFALLWTFGYSEEAFGMILKGGYTVMAGLTSVWHWFF